MQCSLVQKVEGKEGHRVHSYNKKVFLHTDLVAPHKFWCFIFTFIQFKIFPNFTCVVFICPTGYLESVLLNSHIFEEFLDISPLFISSTTYMILSLLNFITCFYVSQHGSHGERSM